MFNGTESSLANLVYLCFLALTSLNIFCEKRSVERSESYLWTKQTIKLAFRAFDVKSPITVEL